MITPVYPEIRTKNFIAGGAHEQKLHAKHIDELVHGVRRGRKEVRVIDCVRVACQTSSYPGMGRDKTLEAILVGVLGSDFERAGACRSRVGTSLRVSPVGHSKTDCGIAVNQPKLCCALLVDPTQDSWQGSWFAHCHRDMLVFGALTLAILGP